MIKIFATEKVKDIDKYTILNMPIAPIDLVEEAVTAFVNEFYADCSDRSGGRGSYSVCE